MEIAVRLGAIREQSPADYYYLKGWVHCLMKQEGKADLKHLCNHPAGRPA
jgi:hypothetical protein